MSGPVEPRSTPRSEPCRRCSVVVEHRISIGMHHKVWLAQPHQAPCGLACVGGGVKAPRGSHGYLGECPRCGAVKP